MAFMVEAGMVTATAGAAVMASAVIGAGVAARAFEAVKDSMVGRAFTEAAGSTATPMEATRSMARADSMVATAHSTAGVAFMVVADPTVAAIDSR